jgi:hypothetical protein
VRETRCGRSLSRKKKWLIGIGVAATTGLLSLVVAAAVLGRWIEPYVREQAIAYLKNRFESDVELTQLRIHLPKTSALRLIWPRGRGTLARVEGEGIRLRHKGRRDVSPMFGVRRFHFDVELATLFDTRKVIPTVFLEGMEITIPPKGDRPKLGERITAGGNSDAQEGLLVKVVIIKEATLVILPKDRKKFPLSFGIQNLRLDLAGTGSVMRYDASLTIPKPSGAVHSVGSFGPWNAAEPGDTALCGDYTLKEADLGVFGGIAGILSSTGHFEGTLDTLHARGETYVPDFRLTGTGNAVPLTAEFEALVDGTNGNTTLQPVRATLGTTKFTTSGGVIKHEGEPRRSVSLDVSMYQGNLRDILRLAVKGNPFMEGQIFLETKIEVPPLSGKVREKLILDGRFEVRHGKFLRSATQDDIDSLSRRGQGQPNSEGIDEVVSGMRGRFKLENEVLRFRSLFFAVPGAKVDLKGTYDLHGDALDFHGTLKLQAKVSQTMTGWKRWALKPVDPFFAKEGAGSFFRIKVTGSSREPKFGLDRGRKTPSL